MVNPTDLPLYRIFIHNMLISMDNKKNPKKNHKGARGEIKITLLSPNPHAINPDNTHNTTKPKPPINIDLVNKETCPLANWPCFCG